MRVGTVMFQAHFVRLAKWFRREQSTAKAVEHLRQLVDDLGEHPSKPDADRCRQVTVRRPSPMDVRCDHREITSDWKRCHMAAS